MSERKFKTRLINKHDTQYNWEKAENFIPLQGEIICYDIDENHPYERFKIGDGTTNVNSLPFTEDILKTYTDNAVSQKSQVQIVTSDENTEILPTLQIHKLTQEEYDEKVASGNIDENVLYLTPDEEINLNGYATIEQLEEKADVSHTHDDKYYTETEIDDKLANKSDLTHNHDSKYDTKGSADSALESAKIYTDNAVAQKSQVQIITWEADD